MRRLATGSLVLAVALAAAPARAGDPLSRSSVAPAVTTAPAVDPAQALFDVGVADMEAGRFEKACPSIEASQRLDPRPGTLFTLAECEAQRGRVATSMRYYAEYLTLYRNFTQTKKNEQKDRATTSEAQLRRLDLLVPRLTLVLPPQSGSDVVIKRDGEVVPELSLGTALAVDPGEHVVTTQTPGGAVHEQRISLAPGETKTLRLVVHVGAADVSSPDVPGAASPSTTGLFSPPPAASIGPWKVGALSAGAMAVAGLAVGTITGVLALQQRSTIDRHCTLQGNTESCDDTGLEARQRLGALGTASTIGFIAGGVGFGVGVALLVAAPESPTPSSTVGRSQTSGTHWQGLGLSVGGKF